MITVMTESAHDSSEVAEERYEFRISLEHPLKRASAPELSSRIF